MNVPERFKHFFVGENRLFKSGEEFIIHLAEPRVLIRYLLAESYFEDFHHWRDHVAVIDWLDGPPHPDDQRRVIADAWEFLRLDEAALEADLDDIADEEALEDPHGDE